MKTSNIIELSVYQAPAPPKASSFDFAAYEARAAARFRWAKCCALIVSIAEALVTAAIGLCAVFGVLIYFSILI